MALSISNRKCIQPSIAGSIKMPNKRSVMDIGHAIISTVILSLTLILLGEVSVIGKRVCTEYGLSLRLSILRQSVVMTTDCSKIAMIIYNNGEAKMGKLQKMFVPPEESRGSTNTTGILKKKLMIS